MNDLNARIQQRKEIDRRKVDEIADRDLQAYGERSYAIVNDKLRITEAVMEKGLGRIQGLLRRGWLRPLVIGLLVGLGPFW